VHKREVDLNHDIFQHEQKIDCSMIFFEVFNDDIVAEDKDQPTEELIDVSRFFLVDEIADVDFFPRYDDYNDDHDIDFLEHPTTCYPLGSFQFQQSHGITQPAYFIYENENKKNNEFVDENSLPLCFSSFELLKENFKITTEDKGV
jgi:hypothetical protein